MMNNSCYFIVLKKDLEANEGLAHEAESFADEIVSIDTQLGTAYKLVFFKRKDMQVFQFNLEDYHIPTFEADVYPDRRKPIDSGESYPVPDKILYFDIETDARYNSKPENPVGRVLSIAGIDTDSNEYFICEENEHDMFAKFSLLSRKYKALAGWYSLHFDIPYLKNRASKLGLEPVTDYVPIYEWTNVDLLSIYRDLFKRTSRSFSLGEVAKKEEIGDKFLDIGKYGDASIVYDWFKNDQKTLYNYNMQDCILCKKLDEKLHLSEVFFDIVSASHSVPYAILRPQYKTRRDINFLNINDSLVLHFAGKRVPRYIFPTRQYMEYEERNYEGAVVFDVVPGLHDNVLCIDFKSMYPSIMRSWNMGIETFERDKATNYRAMIGGFRAQPKSIFCEIIEHLTERIDHYKKEMRKCAPGSKDYDTCYSQRFAYKKVLLSLYGSIAFPGSRFGKIEIAENITGLGREIIKKAAEIAGKYGVVIAGDTDSLFVKVKENNDLPAFGESICNEIIKEVKSYIRNHYGVNFIGSIEVDKVFSKFLLTDAKKKYSGIVIHEGGQPCAYIHTIGFELLRGDVGEAAANFQEQLIKMILTGQSNNDIKEYIKKSRERLFSSEINDQLITYKTVNQELDDYKVNTPHTTAAKKLVKMGFSVKRGSKIAFIKYGPEKDDVMPIRGKDFQLNYRAYTYIWEHQFIAIAERLGIFDKGGTTLDMFTEHEMVYVCPRGDWEGKEPLGLGKPELLRCPKCNIPVCMFGGGKKDV